MLKWSTMKTCGFVELKRQVSSTHWLVYNFGVIFRHFAEASLKQPQGTLVEKVWSMYCHKELKIKAPHG